MSHPSGTTSWIAHTFSGLLPDPDSAEHCSRCHIRLNRCLEPTRAELNKAAQSSQIELLQEVSADLFQQLSPEPCVDGAVKGSPLVT